MKKFIVLYCLVILSISHAVDDQTLPLFEQDLKQFGIDMDYSSKSVIRLQNYIDKNLTQIELDLTTAEDDLEDDLKLKRDFYKQSLVYLTKLDTKDLKNTQIYYTKALRVIYSMNSNFIVQDPMGFNLKSLPTLAERLDTELPYVKKELRDYAVGMDQALLEADTLIHPITQQILTKNQISKLSYNQIANLDVTLDDPFWFQESARLKNSDTWAELENWVNKEHGKRVIKKIAKKFKDEGVKESMIEAYDLHKAHQVLFFSKIKSNATAPKINTKDAYGQTWKLKWGTEVQVEPLLNRMAMKLGAKFVDLVYVNEASANDLVLVLESKKEKGSCDLINSLELLKECLLSSSYEFDVSPYIHEHSIITKENVDKVLKNLPLSLNPEYSKKSAIGREYVVFKESIVEFKSDEAMTRGGGIALSSVGATKDRAIRGNLILTAFMANIDQKDDNSVGVIVKDLKYCPEPCYLEFTHDFGTALGFKKGLDLNYLANKKYIMRNSAENLLTIKQFMLFRPLAYDQATFSDALWMAKKIVSLKKSDLASFAKFTKWPDYMQEATVQILLDRRNQIAQAFDIENLLPEKNSKLEDLEISVSLKTKSERENVARKYRLPLTHIEAEMRRAHLLQKDGQSKYVDKLISKNEVVSCEDSLITNLLEKYYFPTGLSRRAYRHADDKPLENCIFRELIKYQHKK